MENTTMKAYLEKVLLTTTDSINFWLVLMFYLKIM